MSGDIDAYTELFMGHRRELCISVRRFIDSLDEAEDVVQEIYLLVFKAIQGKDPSGFNLGAYLYKSAKRKAREFNRITNEKFPKSDDEADYEEAPSAWDASRAFEDRWDKEARDSLNDKIKVALEDGDSEGLDKLRDELRRSMREIKRPDSEDKEDG